MGKGYLGTIRKGEGKMDFTNLKAFMDDMAANHTPGAAIEVYYGGKKVFRYACGYSDLASGQLMTGQELFHIYSCSKVTTVTAGAQLLERGKFLLTDPLSEYIPEFAHMQILLPDGTLTEAKNQITVGDCFSMTAGFTYNMRSAGFERAREVTGGKMDTAETIRCMASDPLSFEPGSKWQYSLGHDVLGALISVVSGQKFRDYVKENIFDPLGMTESVYHPTEEMLERMATQYRFEPFGSEGCQGVTQGTYGCEKKGIFVDVGKKCSHILGEEYDSGGAGIVTCVSDYAKLTAALANYGMGLTGERILGAHTVDLMRTNRLTVEQMQNFSWKQLVGYGYGMGVRTHLDRGVSGINSNIGEFGWGGAAGATVIVDPKVNLGVFFAQHTLNPREEYYQPRLKNVVYSCL